MYSIFLKSPNKEKDRKKITSYFEDLYDLLHIIGATEGKYIAMKRPNISLLNRALTAQKMKFSINDFFSKYDQISSLLRIWSHLLKKS